MPPKQDYTRTFNPLQIWKDWFNAAIGGRADINGLTLLPNGNYKGYQSYRPASDGAILNNPWGVAAFAAPRSRQFQLPGLSLQAGQSFNFLTGQLSDPNLHANTAQRLNNQINQRSANEAGVNTGGRGTSVLGTLDQMYFANASTKVQTSYQLSGIQAVNQTGTTVAAPKQTILGGNS